MKGISPGPFTEEFLTREQGTLRLLGSLCMAGDTSSCMFAMMHGLPCAAQCICYGSELSALHAEDGEKENKSKMYLVWSMQFQRRTSLLIFKQQQEASPMWCLIC